MKFNRVVFLLVLGLYCIEVGGRESRFVLYAVLDFAMIFDEMVLACIFSGGGHLL
jgi:hypothetical protein